MNNYKSALIFEKYVVDKVSFQRNSEYDSNEKKQIEFTINKEVEKDDNNNMTVRLSAFIFQKSKEYNYPFEMEITLTVFFKIDNPSNEINYEPNAIAILYPYIRAIVSTYTASANVMPLILSAINVNNFIKQRSIA